ncbi:TPM domain-containing protein [Leptospira sp. 96542]|nr:TPM domain-containing protein [Leptospira sp. 96542]
MKHLIISLSFFLFVFPTFAFPVPELNRQVTDLAQVLSQGTIEKLESTIKAHEEATSNQIAVLIVPSLEGEPIEDVSIQVTDKWKLGQASKDNGVLVLISINDRKMRIEVGSGLEGALTDLVSSRIVKQEMRPRFKQNDYDGGVTAAVNAIIGTINGEYSPSDSDVETNLKNNDPEEIVGGSIAGLVFLFISMSVSGFVGLVLTGVGAFVLLPALIWVFGETFGTILAFILFFIVLFLKRKIGNSGGWGDGGGYFGGGSSWSSGGSDWSSGDSWSGGGGDFSGGGSSGDW